jgi:hypothetical protein
MRPDLVLDSFGTGTGKVPDETSKMEKIWNISLPLIGSHKKTWPYENVNYRTQERRN